MTLLPKLLSLAILTMPTSQAASPQPMPSSSPHRAALLASANAAASKQLGKPVLLEPVAINVLDEHAFLMARLLDANGQPFDYDGTPLAAAASAGGVSHRYAALVRLREGTWQVLAQAIGPTDVAWESWPAEFGVPAALFAID